MKNLAIILLVAGAALISSCSPVYYGPKSQNVPLLSHKGEYNIAVNGGPHTLELQGSVSPADNLGLQLNGAWYITEESDSGDNGTGYVADLGVGFYKAFGPADLLVFETYLIGGIGGVENTFLPRPGTTNAGTFQSNIGIYGFQPSFGVKWKYVDAAISGRFMGVSYFNDGGNLVFNDVDQRQYIDDNRTTFVIEPAFTLRAGVDFIKVQFQVAGSYNVVNPDFYQRSSTFTLGVILSPNRYRNIFAKK